MTERFTEINKTINNPKNSKQNYMEQREKMANETLKNKLSLTADVSETMIQNMVYIIRGQQVMLDSDLAMLYQVETKRLNEVAKRNAERFPEDFRFQLSEEECGNLRSQIATSSYGGRRYLPYVFTEQGIAMLSAVLRSEVAISVSINIMKAFVAMRKFMLNNSLLIERINDVEIRQIEYKKEADRKFEEIFDYIGKSEEPAQKIFFDGQIYDAFSLMTGLVESANQNLILIDNYVDVGTLNILAKKKNNVPVRIYTLHQTRLTVGDIQNFNSQYPLLEVKYTSIFHDRFLIVDNITMYHIGASLKDAGKKCFAINAISDSGIINEILQRIASIT